MPIHDWAQVDAGIFHHFHTQWLSELSNALNGGLLPGTFYALTEQHASRFVADVLTLHASSPNQELPLPPVGSGTAVAEAPPQVRHRLTVHGSLRQRRRTLAIRHVSGHRLVALVEIVSPANKDRAAHVAQLASKIEDALWHGIHVLLVDLFAPGPHDPGGLHGAVWEKLDDAPDESPDVLTEGPFILASYAAGPQPEAYLEHVKTGQPLPDMPLFLHPERYINVPLEATYAAAFRGTPAYWRDVLEGRDPAGPR